MLSMENSSATIEEKESQGRCGEGMAAWMSVLGGVAEEGGDVGRVVWTSLGPLPRWVLGPTTQWAPGTTQLVPHGT
jgi:hypothetical protein